MPDTNSQRYRLNAKQLYYLKLMYKFRFVTTPLLSNYQHKKATTTVYLALQNLVEQKYIGRHYAGSYRLRGQAATYYLLPKGTKILKDNSVGTPKVFHNIYKDKSASEQFMTHCLSLFTIYNHLRNIYGTHLKYFSKSELASSDYDYFPQPLPDAYLTLTLDNRPAKELFLDYFGTNRPFFIVFGRISKYIKYAQSGQWDADGTLPTILIVCETPTLEKRLHKKLLKLPGVSTVDVLTTTKNRIVTNAHTDTVWCTADKPDNFVALARF